MKPDSPRSRTSHMPMEAIMPDSPRKESVSIVTTLYYSAPYLEEFYERCKSAALNLYERYEFIFVNDGSPDDSLAVAMRIHERDPRVKIIDLSRNFGHHKAIMTGLMNVRGDHVFLMDCDLEESPEWLPEFLEEMEVTKADVVYGVQRARKGGLLERLTGYVFYRLFNAMAGIAIPANLITARLMTARYVRALVQHTDHLPFLAGLWQITGFEQAPWTVEKKSKGTSSYTTARKIGIVIDSITSFSVRPLSYIFLMGCFFVFLSCCSIGFVLVRYFFYQITIDGWTSLIISLWLFGGLTLFSIGVIGVYLSRVLMEVKPWPFTIIRRIYSRQDEAVERHGD